MRVNTLGQTCCVVLCVVQDSIEVNYQLLCESFGHTVTVVAVTRLTLLFSFVALALYSHLKLHHLDALAPVTTFFLTIVFLGSATGPLSSAGAATTAGAAATGAAASAAGAVVAGVTAGAAAGVVTAAGATTGLAAALANKVNDITGDETQANQLLVLGLAKTYIENLSTQRSLLGAYQNQIEFTVSNTTELASNLSAARSSVQDTDYASETASLTKGQILQQAATAMLAQANQQPQAVLSLLK